MLFGLAPAIQASRADIADALKASGTTKPLPPGRFTLRGRSLLVASELALSLMLLAGAGLMIRSLGKLTAIDLGVSPDRLLTLRLSVPGATARQAEATFTQLMERIAASSGVESVALSDCTAAAGGCSRAYFDPSTDTPGAPGKIRPEVGIHVASPRYLETLKIPLIKGRWFTESDVRDRPLVAVVSQLWAQRFWPGQGPLGRHIGISRPGFNRDVEVIGVVGDVRYARIENAPIPDVYVSYRQIAQPRSFYQMLVRTTVDPLALVPAIREQVRGAGGNLVAADIKTMPERLVDATAQARFNAVLLGSFAALALTLAAIGIYGVMAHSVTERTREIGIRVALGAGRGDVVGMFLRRAAWLTGAGLALGLAGALSASRVLTTLLYETQPYDVVTYFIISGLLATVALIAVWIPARRAAAVEPTVALRAE